MSGAHSWSPEDSERLYRVDAWGAGYFGISPSGKVMAYPSTDRARGIDLHEVMQGMEGREITSPLIIRLPGILEHRMKELRRAFDAAIDEFQYEAGYACVYPIKVNQERHVCEAVRDYGAELGFGLEVGSKPELIAGLALTQGFEDMPLVCNGFKDAEYIETVVLAAKMGRNITPVMEQAHELRLLESAAASHDVRPDFGIRAKLAAPGVGRWAGSSGIRGKFGLTVGEILHAVDYLNAVHVTLGDNGRWKIETIVEGESVQEVLSYVQFEPEDMRRRLRQDIEAALEADRITLAESASMRRFLDDGLQGYTYLE